MDSESILTKSRKIRIYVNHDNKIKLNKYFGLSRYWFNKTIEYLKQPKTVSNFYKLRKIIQYEQIHPDWAFESPQRIREFAIKDACKAIKNAKIKFKQTRKIQKVKFKSKKHKKQSFGFDKISLKNNKLFGGKNEINFLASEVFTPCLEGTRLIFEQGKFYVIVPEKVIIKKPENQRFPIVALDPGIRTFVSYYAPQCGFGKIAQNDFNYIFKLCLILDKLQSKKSKAKSKQKRNLNKAMIKLRFRINNLIDDLHHKSALFLVKNFDTVVVPYFEIKYISQKLHHRSSRNLLNFKHFKFKQFLKFKAKEYSCKIIEISEAYTSKTCSYCGTQQDIGSKKIFKCACGAVVDRDFNGARGILLRALVASPLGKWPMNLANIVNIC